jgi:hypothetical protein
MLGDQYDYDFSRQTHFFAVFPLHAPLAVRQLFVLAY